MDQHVRLFHFSPQPDDKVHLQLVVLSLLAVQRCGHEVVAMAPPMLLDLPLSSTSLFMFSLLPLLSTD